MEIILDVNSPPDFSEIYTIKEKEKVFMFKLMYDGVILDDEAFSNLGKLISVDINLHYLSPNLDSPVQEVADEFFANRVRISRSILRRFSGFRISIKSTTINPPISRRRS